MVLFGAGFQLDLFLLKMLMSILMMFWEGSQLDLLLLMMLMLILMLFVEGSQSDLSLPSLSGRFQQGILEGQVFLSSPLFALECYY